MNPSIIDSLDMAELRLWALRGLVCNPHMLPTADGTLFMAGECGYKIFEAMREIVELGQELNPLNTGNIVGYDSKCLTGIIDVFTGVKIDEYMAMRYMHILEKRMEVF